jgi:hypothetical protein
LWFGAITPAKILHQRRQVFRNNDLTQRSSKRIGKRMVGNHDAQISQALAGEHFQNHHPE